MRKAAPATPSDSRRDQRKRFILLANKADAGALSSVDLRFRVCGFDDTLLEYLHEESAGFAASFG